MLEETLTHASMYAHAIFFLVSIIFCALFSFLETSITALRLYKLKELAAAAVKYKKLFEALEQNQNRILTTILIANNIASVAAATTGALFADNLFSTLPESIGMSLSILFTTAVILIVGEVVPKNIAKVFGESFFHSTLWITNVIYYLLYPIVSLFLKLSDYMIVIIGGKNVEPTEEIVTSEKEIRFLIDYINKKGLLEEEKTAMLKSIFELGNIAVRDILIPYSAIVAISTNASYNEAIDLFKKYQFSRLPVYQDHKSNIIGMLHIKDIFTLTLSQKSTSIATILRPILLVSDTLKINQLLKEFKEQHMHLAMVVNQQGKIMGLVTLEDVLEEIVGEIHDEYETNDTKIIEIKPHVWLVNTSITLEELEKYIPLTFETQNALTLGGFLTENFRHLIQQEEIIYYKGFTFQIQRATHRKALQVLIFSQNSSLES